MDSTERDKLNSYLKLVQRHCIPTLADSAAYAVTDLDMSRPTSRTGRRPHSSVRGSQHRGRARGSIVVVSRAHGSQTECRALIGIGHRLQVDDVPVEDFAGDVE